MELFFEVNNQKMERIDLEEPVNNSQEYLKLSFDFKTDDWEGTTKFAFFRVQHVNYSYPLTDDSILVPSVFLNSKHLDFGVYGVGGEDYRITTNSLRIKFRESKFWSLSDTPLSITELIDKLFEEKADLTYVDEQLLLKSDKTYVDEQLELKADLTYVDEQLDLKADLVYVDTELADKVDKVDGKELSSNDFTDEYVNLIETHQENINDLSVNKVDKVVGKELSTNDFTNAYKSKLDNLDNDLNRKADKTDTYTKTEVNNRVNVKADKTYVDDELNKKSDKTYVDNELSKKADKNNTYTKTEVDTRVNLKSDKTYVDNKLLGKVDKVSGKGLSSNDFTNYYKNFIDGFDGDIEAFLLDHKEEIEAIISQDVVDAKADKTYVDSELELKSDKTYVDELIHRIDNKFIIKSDKQIIGTGDNVDLLAKIKEDGFPVIGAMIHFFEKISPVIRLSASPSNIEIGDNSEIYARVRDIEDGSYAVNTRVHFFERIDPAIKVSASQPVIEIDDTTDVYAKVYDTDGSLATNLKVHFFKQLETIFYNSIGLFNDVDLGVSKYSVYLSFNDVNHITIGGLLSWNGQQLYTNDDLMTLYTEYEGDYIEIMENIVYYGENSFDLSTITSELHNNMIDGNGEVIITK